MVDFRLRRQQILDREYPHDDEVDLDPDSAVKMMGSAAAVVNALPDEQQQRLVRVLGELADAEQDLGRRDQLRSLPFACGLVGEPWAGDETA